MFKGDMVILRMEMLTSAVRYINLQEEYIKDEQRSAFIVLHHQRPY